MTLPRSDAQGRDVGQASAAPGEVTSAPGNGAVLPEGEQARLPGEPSAGGGSFGLVRRFLVVCLVVGLGCLLIGMFFSGASGVESAGGDDGAAAAGEEGAPPLVPAYAMVESAVPGAEVSALGTTQSALAGEPLCLGGAGSHVLRIQAPGFAEAIVSVRVFQADEELGSLRVVLQEEKRPLPGAAWSVESGSGSPLQLAWIPPGTFQCGSTDAERSWAVGPEGQASDRSTTFDRYGPVLREIPLGFWLGVTEVTVAQWAGFVAATGYVTTGEKAGSGHTMRAGTWTRDAAVSWRDPKLAGYRPGDTDPVVAISWHDAMAFCDWLTQRERDAGRLGVEYAYRLPTEVEWEYACRGGNERGFFWWGDSALDAKGRLNGADQGLLPDGGRWGQGSYPFVDGFPFPSPVDHFAERGRNGFGLADMLGNVGEWCLEWQDEPGGTDMTQVTQGNPSAAAVRGGSFDSPPGDARCAKRLKVGKDVCRVRYGFRVCLGVRP